MSHASSARRGVHASPFIGSVAVILVVGAVTLEEISSGESFGADLDDVHVSIRMVRRVGWLYEQTYIASETLPESMGRNVSLRFSVSYIVVILGA